MPQTSGLLSRATLFLAGVLFASLTLPVVLFAEDLKLEPGSRVLVDRAGAGHRAIVLKVDGSRCYIAYEGLGESFDEWVDRALVRDGKKAEAPAQAVADSKPSAPMVVEALPMATPVPEPLPRSLTIPRQSSSSETVEVWLEAQPRAKDSDPVRFNTAVLAAPLFSLGDSPGISTTKAPLQVALLAGRGGKARGFVAIEDGLTLYRSTGDGAYVRSGQLEQTSLENFPPEYLCSGDLNADGEEDIVVVAGPLALVYFGTADGRYLPAAAPYRSKLPLRSPALGRFFDGSIPYGVAVIEGENTFRLLSAVHMGLSPVGSPYEVKFDRIVSLVSGDFDGDHFTDLAVTSESSGRSTGAWMFFNQRGTTKPFLWPVGGKDDFARALYAVDLDNDGRCDLIMTDGDVERGEHIRVVFGAAGRAGWEDPWELIGSEYGVGFGTAAIVTGDFNGDGRFDIGITGRNGLRLYLGADYRRFGRNPVWPRLANGDFPEQRNFLAGNLAGDGRTSLLGYTPVFATGYNIVLGAPPTNPAGLHIPAPLKTQAPAQASSTITLVQALASQRTPGVPTVHHLASRAEPYGQYRYRIIVEVAVLAESVVKSVEATCKYDKAETPLEEVRATAKRQGDQTWFLEVILPRGRNYEFTVTAFDDKGQKADPVRITVKP